MRLDRHTTTRSRRFARAALALLLAPVIGMLTSEQVVTQAGNINCAPVPGVAKEVCIITGRLTSDTTLDADRFWLLRGAVFVENGAVLTISPGTEIFGEFATNGTLVIARGAQIHANGTAAAPIVMSSDQEIGQRGRADWGGLIINGNAPINVPGGEAAGEGDSGLYGGNDPNDDSGHLVYVRVEFAGTEFSPDNELNGIAFQGVGRGTEVDHVMVKYNKDDGVEFFGGTVDVKHLVLVGIADDSIDWTDGWTGRGQYLIVQQSGDDADQGIEADNNGDNNDLLPRSNPTLFNLTLIGDPDFNEGAESDIGMLIREGTSATIRNFIVTGFKEDAIDVDHSATIAQIGGGATPLTMASGIVFNNCTAPSGCVGQFQPESDFDTAAWVAGSPRVAVIDPLLTAPFTLGAPDFRPTVMSPAITGVVTPSVPPADGFFDAAGGGFIGAVGPAGSVSASGESLDLWWAGWTDFSAN